MHPYLFIHNITSIESLINNLVFWWADERRWPEEKLRCQKLYGLATPRKMLAYGPDLLYSFANCFGAFVLYYSSSTHKNIYTNIWVLKICKICLNTELNTGYVCNNVHNDIFSNTVKRLKRKNLEKSLKTIPKEKFVWEEVHRADGIHRCHGGGGSWHISATVWEFN